MKNLTGVSKVYVELREKRHQEIRQIEQALLVLSDVVGQSEQLVCDVCNGSGARYIEGELVDCWFCNGTGEAN